MTIGTSERGDSIEAVIELGKFRHALVVFGGPKGLEYALEQDVQLRELSDPKHIFDRYGETEKQNMYFKFLVLSLIFSGLENVMML